MSEAVQYKPVSGGDSLGALTIVRPSELAASGKTGVVAEGVFESTQPNKFNEDKLDYFIRADNGDLTIINASGSLAAQMRKVTIGELVRISYNGKSEIKNGPRAGTMAHSFLVETASTAE